MSREIWWKTVSLVTAVGLMALVLAFGSDISGTGLEVGVDAPRDFFAERPADVFDPVATEAAQQRALDGFEELYVPVPETEQSIEDSIEAVFAFAASNALADPRPLPQPDFAASTTTTIAEPTTSSTAASATAPPRPPRRRPQPRRRRSSRRS